MIGLISLQLYFKSVAVKKLSRPFHSDIHAKRTYRELRLLKHFRHENVISMLDVFTPNDSLENFFELYFVTHLMGADLNNIIRTQSLTDDHVKFLTYQVNAWYIQATCKSVQEDKFENKIVLAPKISQNCPVRWSYFTLQVLKVCHNFTIVLSDG